MQKINLYTNNNSFDSSGFRSHVNSVSFVYNNQLHVKQVSANVRLSDNVLTVRDIRTAFNQSQVKINGDAIWPLKPAKSFANTSQFRIDDLSVLYSDLLWMQPALKKLLPFSLLPSDRIMISGNFSGIPRD